MPRSRSPSRGSRYYKDDHRSALRSYRDRDYDYRDYRDRDRDHRGYRSHDYRDKYRDSHSHEYHSRKSSTDYHSGSSRNSRSQSPVAASTLSATASINAAKSASNLPPTSTPLANVNSTPKNSHIASDKPASVPDSKQNDSVAPSKSVAPAATTSDATPPSTEASKPLSAEEKRRQRMERLAKWKAQKAQEQKLKESIESSDSASPSSHSSAPNGVPNNSGSNPQVNSLSTVKSSSAAPIRIQKESISTVSPTVASTKSVSKMFNFADNIKSSKTSGINPLSCKSIFVFIPLSIYF